MLKFISDSVHLAVIPEVTRKYISAKIKDDIFFFLCVCVHLDKNYVTPSQVHTYLVPTLPPTHPGMLEGTT